MKYRVLTEIIDIEAGDRFYIQDTDDNSILYECPNEFVANQVCDQWNRIGVTYRSDLTFD